MVKLLDNYLEKSERFAEAKINIPKFDQGKVAESTTDNPVWVHFVEEIFLDVSMRLSPKTYSIKENSTQVLLWPKLMMMR
ncbi:hypothetical protein ICE98_03058 [Lactococcus lactis]|nr:hypothetical protein [Lactococcus lactis]